MAHYAKCMPTSETIVAIFEKKEEKIELLNEQADACAHFLKELEACSLNEWVVRFNYSMHHAFNQTNIVMTFQYWI